MPEQTVSTSHNFPATECPEPSELAAFLAGSLDSRVATVLEPHILQCEVCLKAMRAISHADSFVEAIRASGSSGVEGTVENEVLVRRIQSHIETQMAAGERTISLPSNEESGKGSVSWLEPAKTKEELGRAGKYRVLRQIGRGGMGVVFEAEDTQLGRRVALKAIQNSERTDSDLAKRFQRETQAIAALRHPGIVTIHDAGIQNGIPFMVMELLEGVTLEEDLKANGLPSIERVLNIGIQISSALSAAHEKGILHRDIKPSNVWLESVGAKMPHVKLLDFGLASYDCNDLTMTKPGTLLGSPNYMSPEQAEAGPLDVRTDLFSLGCVLYRMLTGRSPHVGDNVLAILRSIAIEQPPQVKTLRPETPSRLAELVEQMLSKNPTDRPASAVAVVASLKAIGATIGQRDASRFETKPESSVTGSRRGGGGLNRGKIMAASAGFLAILSVIIIIIITIRDKNGKETKFQVDSEGVESITIRTSDGSVTTTVNASGSKTKSSETAKTDNPHKTNDADKSSARVVQSLKHLKRDDIPKSEIIPGQPEELVAVIGERRGKGWGSVMTMQFDPLGRFLISQPDQEHPKLWSLMDVSQLDSGDVIQSMPWSVASGASRGFSEDGSLLFSGSEIFSVEGETADSIRLRKLANLDVGTTSALFSPDKHWILNAPGHIDANELYAYQFAVSQPVLKKKIRVVDEHGSDVSLLGLQLVANRSLLIGTTHDQASPQRTLVWDFSWTETGPELNHVKSQNGLWQYTDDGKAALQVELGKPARLWDTSSPEPKLVHEFAEISRLGCMSADGTVVAGIPGDGNTLVFVYSSHNEAWKLQTFDTGSNVRAVTASKDGRTVAAGCLDGCVRIFDLSDPVGHEINPPPLFTRITGAEISPDGKLLGTVGWDGAALFDLTTSPPTRLPESECKVGQDKVWSFASESQMAAVSRGELFDVSLRPIKRIPSQSDINSNIWLASSGKSLFELDRDSDLSVRSWELTGRGQFRVGEMNRTIQLPPSHGGFWEYFEPTKPRFVFPSSTGSDIIDLDTGNSVYHSEQPYLGRISGDGALALLFWSGGYPCVVDLAETPPREYPLTMRIYDGEFNDSGTRVVASTNQSIDIIDWVKNEVVYSIPMPGPARYVRLHPDGQHVITVNANGTIYILRLPEPI